MSTVWVQFHSDAYNLVFLHILPDSWKIDLQVYVNLGEDIRTTDAREFKYLG